MMSYNFLISSVVILTSVLNFSATQSCSFTDECNCTDYQGMITVECADANQFPTFITFDGDISYIIVDGDYNSIPAYPFYNLTSIYYGIELRSSHQGTVDIDDMAFKFSQIYPISLSFYNFTSMASIPIDALRNNFTFSYIRFENCSTLTSQSGDNFTGISSFSVDFVKCSPLLGTEKMPIITPAGLAFSFQGNGLREIPEATYSPGLTSLSLANNAINFVKDYGFACSTPANCSTISMLTEIDLSYNNLNYHAFGVNAFANLPHLQMLSLQHVNLGTIPSDTTIPLLLPVACQLQYLDLGFNSITTIPANSFRGFINLTSLNLNGNDIATIEIGAFNGMDSMKALILENMDKLTKVDLLITSGMKSVISLSLSYGALNSIGVANPKELPTTLTTVIVSHNKLTFIDESVNGWLNQTSDKVLDISSNGDDMFICGDDIKWMANYVVCTPMQIVADDTACNDGTSLLDYLKQFASCPKQEL